MGLGRLAVIREKVTLQIIQMALLLISSAIAIVVDIFDFFALWVVVIREQLGNKNRRRLGLDLFLIFLLGLSLGLLLFLGSFDSFDSFDAFDVAGLVRVGVVVGFSA